MRRRELLRDLWYLACPAKEVRPGRMRGTTLLGEPVVLGRGTNGRPFALRDRCPHRGIPLRHGRLVDGTIECGYHGWRFGAEDGRCREIPALTAGDSVRLDRIGVPTYPCRESGGNLWVFVPEGARDPEAPLPPIPGAEAVEGLLPRVYASREFPCHVDWAAIGLMDPAHAAFVHTSWWWNTEKRVLREKEKSFGPAPLGYRMGPYHMTKMARPYRLLGGTVSTEITFLLPGVRVEVLRGEKHSAVDLTAITPVDETRTVVHHAVYWTISWLGILRPILRRMVRTFLEQDRAVVVKQQEGIAKDEGMMFLGDADQEARWYFQLKQEYLESREQGREFRNPVEPRTLRWRS